MSISFLGSGSHGRFSCLLLVGALWSGRCLGQTAVAGRWANVDVDLPSLYGVRVVAAQGDVLYAGGTFTTNYHQNAFLNYLAKWTTNGWESVGGGVGGPVHAIAMSGSNVYVGGTFTNAGGVVANNIALWDGTAWHALGGGLLGQPGSESSVYGGAPSADVVHAIVVDGNKVYAAGSFTNAGGGERHEYSDVGRGQLVRAGQRVQRQAGRHRCGQRQALRGRELYQPPGRQLLEGPVFQSG